MKRLAEIILTMSQKPVIVTEEEESDQDPVIVIEDKGETRRLLNTTDHFRMLFEKETWMKALKEMQKSREDLVQAERFQKEMWQRYRTLRKGLEEGREDLAVMRTQYH